MEEENFHKPVLLKEAIEALNVRKGKKYIDATVGMGGHTAEILKRGGRVLGIDWDPEAIAYANLKLKTENLILQELRSTRHPELISEPVPNSFRESEIPKPVRNDDRSVSSIFVQGNFRNIKKIAKKHGFNKVAGILFDLGLSSWQIEKSGRGFSYLRDEPLDMRMDPSQKITAAEIINTSSKEELYEIFTKFGEEVNSRTIANALVSARSVKTTRELAEVVGGDAGQLARVFQALRIVVNDELDNLRRALFHAIGLLEKKGRLVVISFHSLEDRIVKFGLRTKNLRIITKKPIKPSREEIMTNTRARSARMRAAERI